MKVFDVTITGSPFEASNVVSVFADDAAQAVRIAVRARNKQRNDKSKGDIYATSYDRGYNMGPLMEPKDLTAEDVSKVEVIRDRVAS